MISGELSSWYGARNRESIGHSLNVYILLSIYRPHCLPSDSFLLLALMVCLLNNIASHYHQQQPLRCAENTNSRRIGTTTEK